MNYVCTSPAYIGHPHNFLLQLSAEWGLPVAFLVGLAFVLVVWSVAVRIRAGSLNSPETGQLAGLLLSGVVAAALHACVSGVMVTPASQVTGLTICGLLLGLSHSAAAQSPSTVARWIFVPAALLVIGLLVLGAHELRTMEPRSSMLKPGEDMRPRMWQDGKVCRFYVPQNEVSK